MSYVLTYVQFGYPRPAPHFPLSAQRRRRAGAARKMKRSVVVSLLHGSAVNMHPLHHNRLASSGKSMRGKRYPQSSPCYNMNTNINSDSVIHRYRRRQHSLMVSPHHGSKSRSRAAFLHLGHFAITAKQMYGRSRASTDLSMSLIPIPVDELQSVLPTPSRLTPNGDQYVAYFGRTPRQRYNSLFEGVSIAFLGSMFSYFISFVIGQFLATLMGVIFLFWPILSPEFKAYQRNWELVGGRGLVDVWTVDDDDASGGYWSGTPEDKRGLYGGYYVTRIEDVCVVDDVRATSDDEYDLDEFRGYTMATDELENMTGLPWKLRLRLQDEEGRGMQVHSRLSEDYLDIQPGMGAVGVLLSTSRRFEELAGMTDFCILDNGVGDGNGGVIAWVGDYPYLDKDVFLRTLNDNGVMDTMLDFDYDEDDDFDEEIDDEDLYDDAGEEGSEGGEEYITVR